MNKSTEQSMSDHTHVIPMGERFVNEPRRVTSASLGDRFFNAVLTVGLISFVVLIISLVVLIIFGIFIAAGSV